MPFHQKLANAEAAVAEAERRIMRQPAMIIDLDMDEIATSNGQRNLALLQAELERARQKLRTLKSNPSGG